jgi:hypothetical protein
MGKELENLDINPILPLSSCATWDYQIGHTMQEKTLLSCNYILASLPFKCHLPLIIEALGRLHPASRLQNSHCSKAWLSHDSSSCCGSWKPMPYHK